MKALIVYDSVFGNTEKIARSVAAALNAPALPVNQVQAETLRGLDVLIVGSPTRGFRPTEQVTKFLNALPREQLAGMKVAAFDTRIALETIGSKALRFMVDKGGYAANTIARALVKKGGKMDIPPAGFLVTGEEGPLKEGELERAADWARGILISDRTWE